MFENYKKNGKKKVRNYYAVLLTRAKHKMTRFGQKPVQPASYTGVTMHIIPVFSEHYLSEFYPSINFKLVKPHENSHIYFVAVFFRKYVKTLFLIFKSMVRISSKRRRKKIQFNSIQSSLFYIIQGVFLANIFQAI